MSAISDAAGQAWPPFALVAGLLCVGAVAEAEGLFAAAAGRVTRPGRTALGVLAGLLLLDAAVTAVLNLDTAAAFMTPLMLYAARGLGVGEAPFLYGAVLMANAASLLLPGANLTNLLVLAEEPESGATFIARTLPAALAAAVVTGAGLLWWAHRTREHPVAVEPPRAPAFRPGPGTLAVVVAAALVVALPRPALPVLGVGLLTGAVAVGRAELDLARLRRAVGPASLLALLAVAIGLGTLARDWSALDDALSGLARAPTTAVAAGASVAVNNLPAATLLSAHPPAHPRALLLGLDLGPNLAVTGSLSALIWWRSATALGARPSAWTYTRVGAPLAILAMAAGLLALAGT
jgi:arsenical pump membrane protein